MLKQMIVRLFFRMGYELQHRSKNRLHMNWPEVSKFLYFQRLFDRAKNLDGDVVECGVAAGHSLIKFAYLMQDFEMKGTLWGFDSFEGFPEPTEGDRRAADRLPELSEFPEQGYLKYDVQTTTRLFVRYGLGDFLGARVKLVKGYFEDTLTDYDGRIAILHADADLYGSYKTILQELYPKVVPGGIVLFDEYDKDADLIKWPGAKKAIDEFFGDEVGKIQTDPKTGYAYLVKEGRVVAGAAV